MVVADPSGVLSTQAIPGGGGGAVTGVAVATANGFSGTSDGAAVVPTLTLTTSINSPILAGNGTAISAATTTGSGSTAVLSTSPTLVTPVLGVATATSIAASNSLLSKKDGSNTAGSGPVVGFENAAGNRQHFFQLDGSNNIATQYYNGTTYSNGHTLGNNGSFTAKGTIFSKKDGSDTEGLGGVIGFENTSGNRQSFFQLSASNNIDAWFYNGSTYNKRHTFGNNGDFTAVGAITGSNLSGTNTGDQINITGNAATVTTNANLTGVVTSVGNATSIADAALSIAKTSGLQSALDLKAPLASPALTGAPTAPTQTALDNSTKIATTAYVENAGTTKANLNSPALTGTPTAPTAAAGTNNTQIATTAYVDRLGGGTITSGRYDGLITGGTNVGGTSYTVNGAHYKRIGNEVTVTGRCSLTTTASGSSIFYVDLPIASNLAVGVDLLGSATADANSSNLVIYADTGSDRALVEFTAAAAASMEVYYNFTYTIL